MDRIDNSGVQNKLLRQQIGCSVVLQIARPEQLFSTSMGGLWSSIILDGLLSACQVTHSRIEIQQTFLGFIPPNFRTIVISQLSPLSMRILLHRHNLEQYAFSFDILWYRMKDPHAGKYLVGKALGWLLRYFLAELVV